jgi:hypothetical protein
VSAVRIINSAMPRLSVLVASRELLSSAPSWGTEVQSPSFAPFLSILYVLACWTRSMICTYSA